MRQFAKEYPDFPFVQVSLAQLENENKFMQVPLAFICSDLMTWSHLITINKSYTAENELNKTWMKIDLLKTYCFQNDFI